MVKVLVFTRKKTVKEIFEEANIQINPATVFMQETSDGYVFYLPDDVPEEEIAKLEKYFSQKGLKREKRREEHETRRIQVFKYDIFSKHTQ